MLLRYNRSIIIFLVQGLALGMGAAASPGPFQAFLINQTLIGGFRRSAPISLAPLICDIPIVTLILLLLDQLPPSFLRGISMAGGVFLLYLALGLWRQWRQGPAMTVVNQPPSGGLWRGVLMNALSPGPYTYWTLVNGPILLSALHQSWLHGILFILGFYGAMITSLVGIAAFFHQARRLGPRVVHSLTLASIVIMVIFGGLLLVQGIRG